MFQINLQIFQALFILYYSTKIALQIFPPFLLERKVLISNPKVLNLTTEQILHGSFQNTEMWVTPQSILIQLVYDGDQVYTIT